MLLNHHDKFNRIQKNINIINFNKILSYKHDRLVLVLKNINDKIKNSIQKSNEKIQYLNSHINSLNPKNVMKRGYSIVYNKNKELIRNVENIKEKEKLDIKLYNGEIEVQNLKVIKK